jgi:hypothetical protein
MHQGVRIIFHGGNATPVPALQKEVGLWQGFPVSLALSRAEDGQTGKCPAQLFWPFPHSPICVTLLRMGSKDKGKKEAKKAPKPKPKPEPGRKREGFTPAPPK